MRVEKISVKKKKENSLSRTQQVIGMVCWYRMLEGVFYCCLNNNCFHYLNNITYIFTFFSPTYIFTKQ